MIFIERPVYPHMQRFEVDNTENIRYPTQPSEDLHFFRIRFAIGPVIRIFSSIHVINRYRGLGKRIHEVQGYCLNRHIAS